jgi:hypothetical protein
MAQPLAVPSKELELAIVGPKESFKATRVQRANMGTDYPVTNVDELGNNLHAGTSKDLPTVTITFSAFDTGIKNFAVLTGNSYTAFPAAGVDIASLGEMDAVFYVKNATAATYAKSAHAKRLQIQNFTFNYSVDGEASEDYTAIGSEKRWLKYDVVVDKFTVGTTSFTLTQTPIQLRNGNKALTVTIDGVYLTEVATAPSAGQYRIVGTTLTTGDTRSSQVLAIYHANAAGAWSYISDATMPASIRGKSIDVKIAANAITRVQSVTINGNLATQPVKEMGNTAIVGYQRQVPTVEGTITVLDTDTDLISLLTYGTIGSGVEWMPGDGCTTSGVSLAIYLNDPCADGTILKTVKIPTIDIVGDSYSATVNQNTTQTFNWRSTDAQCIIYSGYHA